MVSEKSGTVAAQILREAAGIVEGARNQTHGDKERSFDLIATFWDVYLEYGPEGRRQHISGLDVAIMMVLMKIARAQCGQPICDHFVDMAGYAAIAGELSE